jgi:hypothetical protein
MKKNIQDVSEIHGVTSGMSTSHADMYIHLGWLGPSTQFLPLAISLNLLRQINFDLGPLNLRDVIQEYIYNVTREVTLRALFTQ